MIYDLVVRQEVEDEVVEIAQWYESQSANEQFRFINSFENTLDSIQSHPLWYPVTDFGPRKVWMGNYPYFIYFTISENIITVRAIAHNRRNPDWVRSKF